MQLFPIMLDVSEFFVATLTSMINEAKSTSNRKKENKLDSYVLCAPMLTLICYYYRWVRSFKIFLADVSLIFLIRKGSMSSGERYRGPRS